MSKIGKLPVKLPEGVRASLADKKLTVTGSKGTLSIDIPDALMARFDDTSISLSLKKDKKSKSAIYGTLRSEIANMVTGVSTGWGRQLELVGTGYRAEVVGDSLILTVGYSHPVKIEAPEGISFRVEKTFILVEGPDKETVGQVVANIRRVRPPEPYKGKGIKYKDEFIRRKAGKAAKTAGASGAI